jgi:hypothetical protein
MGFFPHANAHGLDKGAFSASVLKLFALFSPIPTTHGQTKRPTGCVGYFYTDMWIPAKEPVY